MKPPSNMASPGFANLVEKIRTHLQSGVDRKFTFLIVGRTGVGKSSTVNSLMGKEVAKTGSYEATTFSVEEYESDINGVKFLLMDTPGLCDEQEEVGNDQRYLDLIKQKVPTIDCLWYVTRLDDTRVYRDEKEGIRKLTTALGPEVWSHGIIVFTFSGKVQAERYVEALTKRTELLRREIAHHAPKHAGEVPSVAVDNETATTPDGKLWLGELYTKVFSRISAKGALPFYLATAKDIGAEAKSTRSPTSDVSKPPTMSATPRIALSQEQKGQIKKQIDAKVIPILATVGAGIGAPFGPIGAAIGGAIGAAIGALAWFSD